MAIDYLKSADKARARFQAIGARWDLLKEDEANTAAPWETVRKYVPAGAIYGLRLPVSSTNSGSLGWGMEAPELVGRASATLIFVCADKDHDPRKTPTVLVEGKENRFLRIETLRPKDETILHYGWIE